MFEVFGEFDSAEEINQAAEGHKLHHCVGSYVQRVSNHLTTMLFIRMKDKPEESIYSMKVRNNEVIQVRGLYNASMTPEVQGFINSFKAKKLKVKKQKEEAQIA